jgi:predicted transposase YbfD/YdcC
MVHVWACESGLVLANQSVAEKSNEISKRVERRCFLSSLPADAARLGKKIRTHWGVENRLHWVLDMAFNEDQCRIRTDHASDQKNT